MKQPGIIERFLNLWRGFWRSKLENTESTNPHLVYSQEIAQHREQMDALKKNASRLVVLRNRNISAHQQNTEHILLIKEEIDRSLRKEIDHEALALIQRKQALEHTNKRLINDQTNLNLQIDKIKSNIQTLSRRTTELSNERDQMTARKAHAESTLHLKQSINSSRDLDQNHQTALENTREAILKLEAEAELDLTFDSHSMMPESLSTLKDTSARRNAEKELEELRRRLHTKLLPASARPPINSTILSSALEVK